MAHLREANERDRSAILELRERCFGEVDPEKRDPRFWDWEFRSQAPARIFVAEEESGIVAHFALIPQRMHADGREVRGALAVDAMTAPGARGRGIYSALVSFALERTESAFDLITAYQIRAAVLGPMLRNGWKIAAQLPVIVRPILSPRQPKVASIVAAESPTHSLTIDDAEEMAAVASSMTGVRTVRDGDWLRWRYFGNPLVQYRVTGTGSGSLDAWLVTRRTTLKGFDTLAVVDLAWRSGSRDTARTLLRETVQAARLSGCRLVASLISIRHPAALLLTSFAFFPSPHRFRLLVRSPDKRLQRAKWAIMWGDTDHL
jgi:GNAT superfamily N-acetyltransferase